MADKPQALPKPRETTLLSMEAFGNDPQLLLFFEEWVTNGFNASASYKKFHPDVTDQSARVLGGRTLAKVNKKIILEAYGLDLSLYLKTLKEGVSAVKGGILKKYDKQGKVVAEIDMRQPDVKGRAPYHDKLGVLLEMEREKTGPEVIVPIQNNNYQLSDEQLRRITE